MIDFKKLSICAGAALLAFSFAADAAQADDLKIKRKKRFLSELFGQSEKVSASQRITWGKKEKSKRKTIFDNWWDGGNGDVNIINGQDASQAGNRRRNLDSGFDPEASDGYGMGNLAYVPEQLISLGGSTAPGLRPATPQEGAIYDALADAALGIMVEKGERDAIVGAYAASGFKPLWIADGKASPRAIAALKVLAAAADEGLDPAAYLPSALTSYDAVGQLPSSDPAAMARFDLGLTAMALKYARHASAGQFDPRKLSRYNDISPEPVDPAVAIRVIGWSPYVENYLMGLHPTHPAYVAMKAALAELRKAQSGAEPAVEVPDGPRVKVGMADPRVLLLRQRLAQLDVEVPAAEEVGKDDVLDATLSATLKTFQKTSHIKQTGILDQATIRALGVHSDGRKEDELVTNMERLRWLPRSLGSGYVFVNQAAFKVQVFEQGKEVWNSRVIVGKPYTQTAVFNDEIETVVFNPSWGVPPSIIANEYLPKLRNDPSYLDRIGFSVTDSRGRRIASSNVDWWSYGGKVPFAIQQPPGRKNALGELKFLFPNTHNIYMHDTPNRDLFNEEVRAFSHGCVRVQNPRDFASVLLGWDRARIDKETDSKKSQSVKLATKVPIYITYFTAWPGETGKIQYFNDIYERDRSMDRARSVMTLAQR